MELALSFTEDFVYISRPLGCIRIDRKNASGDFIAPCAEIAPVNPRTVFGSSVSFGSLQARIWLL